MMTLAYKTSFWDVRHWEDDEIMGTSGHGSMTMIRGARDVDPCPCSKEEMVVQQFQDSVDELDQWMERSLTGLDVRELIKQALLSWKKGVPYSKQTNLWEDTQEDFLEQEQLGWAVCLEGCISMKWRDYQQQYYEWLGILKLGW